jgi:hypothetical protein
MESRILALGGKRGNRTRRRPTSCILSHNGKTLEGEAKCGNYRPKRKEGSWDVGIPGIDHTQKTVGKLAVAAPLFRLAGGYETMKEPENINILFIAGFGPIVRDAGLSQRFYRQALGISFKEENGGYLHTDAVPGAGIRLRRPGWSLT